MLCIKYNLKCKYIFIFIKKKLNENEYMYKIQWCLNRIIIREAEQSLIIKEAELWIIIKMNTINSNKYYIKNKFIYLLKDVQRKFESDKLSLRHKDF